MLYMDSPVTTLAEDADLAAAPARLGVDTRTRLH
jgi:hypothetical protein